MRAIFAGTFDPFTVGHKDIALRAVRLFDSVTVAVALETGKRAVSVDKRIEIVCNSLIGAPNIEVEGFFGLLADYVKAKEKSEINNQKCVLVRGVRGTRDMEYERDLARIYREQCGADTVFLYARAEHEHISSTVVRELARLNAPIDGYVDENAIKQVYAIYGHTDKR